MPLAALTYTNMEKRMSEEHAPEGPFAERHARIAQAAYCKAQNAGFPPGCELEFWLAAEREVDQTQGTGMDQIHVAQSLPEG
jgi:hypothetical protein